MGKVAVIGTAAVVAAAALVVRQRMRSSGRWARVRALVKEFEEKCATPEVKLKQIADAMTVEMHSGLASEGGSKLKMLISFVDNLPNGFIFKEELQLKLKALVSKTLLFLQYLHCRYDG